MSNKKKKYLVVKAKGGMGNRMLCAATGLIYGQLTNRLTVIDWRDGSYSNDGSNSFPKFFTCPNASSEGILPKNSIIRPKIWANELNKSMSRMLHEHDPDKHNSIFVHRKYSVDLRKLDYNEDILVFWYYTHRIRALLRHLREPKHGFAGLNASGVIRKVLLGQMPLKQEITQQINDFKARNWHRTTIGVHIRHTDLKTDLHQYERHLLRFLKRSPNAGIFLATDNRHVCEDYNRRFKNVFSTPKWFPASASTMHQNGSCPDRVANGVEALVDMYLLAECDCLIYSGHSTFSVISRILSNAKPGNIVDIDRFNIKVRFKKLIRDLTV